MTRVEQRLEMVEAKVEQLDPEENLDLAAWISDPGLDEAAAIYAAAYDRAGVDRNHCGLLGSDPRCACDSERVQPFREEWLSAGDAARLVELGALAAQRREAGEAPR